MPDWGLSTQAPSSLGGWGDLLRSGLDLAANYLSLPQGTDTDLPGSDMGRGDPMSTSTWQQTRTGYSQLSTLVIPSPDGKLGFWKASGRPILFSGDLAACKRVARVAARASRAIGHRRSTRGKR
jgi:hypothetical protein